MENTTKLANLRKLSRDAIVLGFSEEYRAEIANQIKALETQIMNDARAAVNLSSLLFKAHQELDKNSTF